MKSEVILTIKHKTSAEIDITVRDNGICLILRLLLLLCTFTDNVEQSF